MFLFKRDGENREISGMQKWWKTPGILKIQGFSLKIAFCTVAGFVKLAASFCLWFPSPSYPRFLTCGLLITYFYCEQTLWNCDMER